MTNGLDMETIATHEEDLDINALNDSQLYEQLKENNIVAGPIVDSTREIYKKKLKKVLYGNDEESFVSGGEAELVSDKEDEDEIEADEEEKKETVGNGDMTGPIMEEDEEGPIMEEDEEVVDGVTRSQCESNSDTDDEQPSGVSRPVEGHSSLRKRVHGNDAEAIEETGPGPQSHDKPKPSPLVFVMVLLVIVMGAAIAIYFLSADMPDAVDSMQEAIQEAANRAASGTDGDSMQEAIQEAANRAAIGTDGEEAFTEEGIKVESGVGGEDSEKVFTF